MKHISKNKFSNSIKWKSINLIATKGLSFVISVIIARLIDPEHYGFMSIWSVILAFGDVIVIGGLDTVLIRKKEIQSSDWNTAFIMCFIRGVVLSVIMFFIAPIISIYFKIPELKILTRLISIDFLSQAFIITGTAKSARNMNFKGLFFADFFATIIGAIVAIGCALYGASIYVLILNNMIHRSVYALIVTIYWKMCLKPNYNKDSAKRMLLDGTKAMSNGLIDLLTSSINGLYIGKNWNANEVGYYNRSQSLIQILGVESYNVISNVLLPTFSSYQEEKIKLKQVTRKIISLSTYLMFPLMFGVAACAEDIMIFLFTDKWVKGVPFLRIACIYYAFNPIRQLCTSVNYSLGKFKKNNLIEFTRLALNLAGIAMFHIWSISSLKRLAMVGSIIAVVIGVMYLNSIKRELEYKWIEIIKDIIPNLVLSLVAILPCVYICNFVNNIFLSLVLSVLAAILVYVGISYILHIEIFEYLLSSLNEIVRKETYK